MIKTSMQLKDKVKKMTKGLTPVQKSEKSQMLIRNYLMERLLERVSVSKYRNNFIIKGGMLVASYTGLEARATKDIDTTVRALTLNIDNAEKVLNEIIQIDLEDKIQYKIESHTDIMEDFEYPGIRFMINAKLVPIDYTFQVDISTDDVITPDAVEYEYKVMLEDRTIPLRTYNLETLLAEKLQTIAARGAANTRTRDFYDIYMLTMLKGNEIDTDTLKAAFEATSQKRGTLDKSAEIYPTLDYFKTSPKAMGVWERFKKSSYFVGEISWEDVIESVRTLAEKVILIDEELREEVDG